MTPSPFFPPLPQAEYDLDYLYRETAGSLSKQLGVWQDWTPSLFASTTSPNLGSTGTSVGRFVQIGRLVVAQFALTFGGSGIDPGVGYWYLTYPQAADPSVAVTDQRAQVGVVRYQFATPGVSWGVLEYESSSAIEFLYFDSSGSRLTAAPVGAATFTPAAADGIYGSFTYEANKPKGL